MSKNLHRKFIEETGQTLKYIAWKKTKTHQIKKDSSDVSDTSYLETQSTTEEGNKQENKSVSVDNLSGEVFNEAIKEKVFDAHMQLLTESFEHEIHGLNFIFFSVPNGYKKKKRLLDSKIKSIKRLSENIELELINTNDAKIEYMRIIHDSPKSLKEKLEDELTKAKKGWGKSYGH